MRGAELIGKVPKALVALTALGAALRLGTLDARSFWFDEAHTVQLLDNDLLGMLAAIPESESTPPLYYVLAWGWSRLFGLGEVGLRSLSAILGAALVVVAYLAAREVFARRGALVAAALVAVNPFLIFYSQEARAYALLALLSGLSLLFFLRARDRQPRALAWWSLVSVLAVATHYFGVFLVAAEAIWLALIPGRRRALATALVPLVAVGAALLPLALAQGGGSRTAFIAEMPLAERVFDLVPSYLIGLQRPALIGAAAAPVGLVALALLLRRGDSEERGGALVMAGIGLGTVVLVLVLSLAGIDYLRFNNLIAVVLPLALFVAAGLGARRAGPTGLAAAAALCVLSVGAVASSYATPKFGENWRAAAEAMGPAPEGRAIVLTRNHGHPPLEIYAGAVPMSAAGASVREIVLLGTAQPSSGLQPTPPARGFERVGSVEGEAFSIVRFRADAPLAIEPEQFRTSVPTAHAVLLDRD